MVSPRGAGLYLGLQVVESGRASRQRRRDCVASTENRGSGLRGQGERGDSRGADAPPVLALTITRFRHLVANRTEAGSWRMCGGFAAGGGSGPDPTADPTPDPTTEATTDGAAAHRARRSRLDSACGTFIVRRRSSAVERAPYCLGQSGQGSQGRDAGSTPVAGSSSAD